MDTMTAIAICPVRLLRGPPSVGAVEEADIDASAGSCAGAGADSEDHPSQVAAGEDLATEVTAAFVERR